MRPSATGTALQISARSEVVKRADTFMTSYFWFLCRCFERSFLCLCLRIFFRLFFITLPISTTPLLVKDKYLPLPGALVKSSRKKTS